jgi:hypothetical protein
LKQYKTPKQKEIAKALILSLENYDAETEVNII